MTPPQRKRLAKSACVVLKTKLSQADEVSPSGKAQAFEVCIVGSNPATSVEAKTQHFVVDKTEMSKKQCFGIITTVQRYTCHISYVWTHLS